MKSFQAKRSNAQDFVTNKGVKQTSNSGQQETTVGLFSPWKISKAAAMCLMTHTYSFKKAKSAKNNYEVSYSKTYLLITNTGRSVKMTVV